MWVSIQQVSKMYAKPERTLRHYAARGKIIVRKKNRSWECDLASVEKLGWTRTEYLGSTESISSNNKIDDAGIQITDSAPLVQSNKQIAEPVKEDAPRKFVLSNLGVYTELLILTKKIKNDINDGGSEKALFENAYKSIQSIAYGFYTYDKSSKVQYFSQARNYLINLLIQIEVNGLHSEADAIKKQVEESILPGLGGLIRRAEKTSSERSKYDKNSRSTNITKN